MSPESLEEVLRLARQLPPDEQKQLIEELARPEPNPAQAESPDQEVKTVGQALRESGFIGSLGDVPEDYATNPKYMEGLGEHGD